MAHGLDLISFGVGKQKNGMRPTALMYIVFFLNFFLRGGRKEGGKMGFPIFLMDFCGKEGEVN